jgi:hypothetical protein
MDRRVDGQFRPFSFHQKTAGLKEKKAQISSLAASPISGNSTPNAQNLTGASKPGRLI